METKKISDKLPFKKSKMSEHLADSNILQSRRTYGRQEKDQRLSVPINESTFVEDMYAEENSESTTCVVSSSYCKKNNNNQKDINSEFSLFNVEDMDYYFSVPADSSKQHNSSLSIPQVSSSDSNYLRVRKNLKNRVSNQQYSSEERSKSILYEENLNFVADANESKSANNFSNQVTQSSNDQNSHLSIINHSKHTKINDVKSNDACVSKLPQNASISQIVQHAEKIPDNGTAFQNPLKNSSCSTNPFSLIELVRRFSVSNYQAHAIKKVIPSKRNSLNKKPSNSRVSIKKSKNATLKSNMMNTQIPDTKIGVAKTSSKSAQKGNIGSIDNVERKAVLKEHTRSAASEEKSIDIISSINNLGEFSKGGAKTPLKTLQGRNNEHVYNTKRNVKVPKKCVSEKKLIENKATTQMQCQLSSNQGTAEKILFDGGDKQVGKHSLILRTECAVQNPAFNNNSNINVHSKGLRIVPLVELPPPPTFLEGACEVTPLCTRKIVLSAAGNHLIQEDNQAVSARNIDDLVIPGPSVLSENVLTSDSNNHTYNNTTLYMHSNTLTDIMEPSNESEYGQTFEHKSTFDVFMANFFDGIRNNCILNFHEYSAKILNATASVDPSLRNCDMTLKNFALISEVSDTYADFMYLYYLNYPERTLYSNKGYDFPENFETENLLSLIKDYVFTTSSYLIPEDANANSIISYSEILAAASSQMSKNELTLLLMVLGNEECSFKLTEVLAKLGHIALIVMYCEYKCRQMSFLGLENHDYP